MMLNNFYELTSYLYTFFGEVTIQVFCTYFNLVVCFLTIEFWKFFIYCGYKSFVGYMICKYFFSVCSLSFYFFKSVILRANVFTFTEVQFLIFLFNDYAFGVMSKNSLSNSKSQRGLHIFFNESVKVLCIMFRSMIHIELIFV